MEKEDLDKKISESYVDEIGAYRMINGQKIYQIEEKTQKDIDLNLAINRVRASGMSAFELLNIGRTYGK